MPVNSKRGTEGKKHSQITIHIQPAPAVITSAILLLYNGCFRLSQ